MQYHSNLSADELIALAAPECWSSKWHVQVIVGLLTSIMGSLLLMAFVSESLGVYAVLSSVLGLLVFVVRLEFFDTCVSRKGIEILEAHSKSHPALEFLLPVDQGQKLRASAVRCALSYSSNGIILQLPVKGY